MLNKQAPLKTNFISYNNNPFMTKELRKTIMKRSQLENRYNKNHNYENWYIKNKGLLCKSSKKNLKELFQKREDPRYNR